jgi:threonyl-tRNA synthetase
MRTERLRFVMILSPIYVVADIPNTGIIKAMKIMSVAGAYWRDEKNKQLTRVYGTSFPKQKI